LVNLDVKISKHAKDLIQKYAGGLFKDKSLEFYGIHTARIKEFINVELPAVEVTGAAADFVFLLEDGTYLHFEFQTTYNEKDLIRFAGYDIRLYERDSRRVITVIIYTANVKDAADGINIGSLVYSPQRVLMKEYDGDSIYRELTAKIEAGQDITDTDMLNLTFLPLMTHTIDSGELAVKSVQLAQRIPNTAKRNACIAAAFAFGSKYLSEDKINELLEALKMTDLATILIQREVGAREKEIAKKLLRRGISTDAVAEDTGLDEATVRELQTELSEAV
jgi:hypothetical protein